MVTLRRPSHPILSSVATPQINYAQGERMITNLESEVKLRAVEHLKWKWGKLKTRKFVLFPWLAYRRLLRKIALVKSV